MVANQQTKTNTSTTFPEDTGSVKDVFSQAASGFIRHKGATPEIWAANRDWFLEQWGRDTFIALPGLLLPTKRFEEAKAIFRQFAKYEQNGIIPNRIQEHQTLYNTVDASLWFIHAVEKYFHASDDTEFIKETLPTLRSIISNYQNGTSYSHFGQDHHIWMDPEDFLISSPSQATWMDADPSGNGSQVITPRNGKCVEINALWYANLSFLKSIETSGRAKKIEEIRAKTKLSFNRKFWNKTEKCLFDVIEGDPHSAAIRPNQIIAISHGKDLISKTRQRQMLQAVTKDLLTPFGLRTLSPRDSHYHGIYNTTEPMHIKDLAYHQGTVWPWLIGPYCDAIVIVWKEKGKYEFATKEYLKETLSPLVNFCLQSEYKSLPEVFSGDQPHEPGGTTSQAWSVSEVFRVMTKYDLI